MATPDIVERIDALLVGVTDGPWDWFGNANSNSLYLATTHSGRRYVMGFKRWGMRGAQPQFQPEGRGLVDAADLLQFEVGDREVVGVKAARKNTSVYRYDIRGIDCADARFLAEARTVVPDLLDEIRTLRARLAQLEMAAEEMAGALDGVKDAMLNGGDGTEGDFGWKISKLTKVRPLIRAAIATYRNLKGQSDGACAN